MSANITIEPAKGLWVVRAAGAVIGESSQALVLNEEGHAPVIYFPREDVGMAFLEKTAKVTTCRWKGEASHYSIHGKSGITENAAWSYEAPIAGMERIAGHIAFYPGKATVEKI